MSGARVPQRGVHSLCCESLSLRQKTASSRARRRCKSSRCREASLWFAPRSVGGRRNVGCKSAAAVHFLPALATIDMNTRIKKEMRSGRGGADDSKTDKAPVFEVALQFIWRSVAVGMTRVAATCRRWAAQCAARRLAGLGCGLRSASQVATRCVQVTSIVPRAAAHKRSVWVLGSSSRRSSGPLTSMCG